MKTKRTLIAVMILSMALLTACSTKESADNSTTSLDDLYQQENQVFADHEDVWNKVFGMMDKPLPIPMEIMRIIWLTPSNQAKRLLRMRS